MEISVTASEKRQFIRWFLQHYELKKRECVWLLNYIADDETLVSHTHFIRHAQYCPKAIIMSGLCSKEVPFQYFKGHVMTIDPEKAFHDIRLGKDEDLFIQLNFKGQHMSPDFAYVMEENPYYQERVREIYSVAAEDVITKATVDFNRRRLLYLVDEALDEGDKEGFYQLTGQLLDSFGKKTFF